MNDPFEDFDLFVRGQDVFHFAHDWSIKKEIKGLFWVVVELMEGGYMEPAKGVPNYSLRANSRKYFRRGKSRM